MSRQGSPHHSSDNRPACYRLTILGAGAVGKTALLKRFLNDEFIEKHRETVEDLYIRTFNVNGRFIQARVFDTAGNIQFPAMRRLSIGHAQAFLLVYDVTSDNSFQTLAGILSEIKELRSGNDIRDLPIVIAANKCDSPSVQWVVSLQRINEFMLNETLDLRAVHMQTSAKTGYNVKTVFETFIKISPLFLGRTIDRIPATAPVGSNASSFDFVASLNVVGQWGMTTQGGSAANQKRKDKAHRRLSLQMTTFNDHNKGNGIGNSNYSVAGNEREKGNDSNEEVGGNQKIDPPKHTLPSTSMDACCKSDELTELRKQTASSSRRMKLFRRNKTKSHDEYDVPECIVH